MKSSITIVTPATSYELITLEDLRNELWMSASEDTQDVGLDALIVQVSRVIANEVNRVLGREEVEEVFRLDGCASSLILSRYPGIVIDSVIEDDGDPLDTDEYEVDVDSGLLIKLSGGIQTNWNSNKVTVAYTGGYELPAEAPGPLALACIRAVNTYRSSSTRDAVLRSENIPGVLERTWWVGNPPASKSEATFSPDIMGLLDPFRNIEI